MPCIVSAILGWGIVLLVTPCLLKAGDRLNRNCRTDFHHRSGEAIPRVGGLALALAFVAPQFIWSIWGLDQEELRSKTAVVTFGCLAIFALGFWDDLQPLGPWKKLFGQVVIAAAVSCSGIEINCLKILTPEGFPGQGALEIVVSASWLVVFTNLINLIDGADGLAGGISLILMTFILCTSFMGGTLLCLTAGMSGALLAFLRYNFPPARIYLGDGGAYLLGFQLGLISMVASHTAGPKALAAPLFGLALPIVDTGLAVVRRSLMGLPLFRPDRNHLHHQLLAIGMSPKRVVVGCYCITLVCLLAGVVGLFCWSGRFLPASIAVVLLVLSACAWKTSICPNWGTLRRRLGESLAMRREIDYALCLRKWLKHEGQRCSSVEDFYDDFRMAANRLGFTTVRLELADGHRIWHNPKVYGARLSACHSFQNGALGILELEAPKCRLRALGLECDSKSSAECAPRCPLWNSPSRFRILGELLAETWIDAARRWGLRQAKLRFDAKLSGGSESHTPVISANNRTAKARFISFRPATLPKKLFGRVLGLVAGVLVLTSLDTLSSDHSESTLLHHVFSEVPRIELPGKAAQLVMAALECDRATATTNIVRAVYRVSPGIVASVVEAISKAVPAISETAAAAAAQEQPERAAVFAKIAARVAPDRAAHIVRAVCTVVPDQYRSIAESVNGVVPGSTPQILDTLEALFPRLRDPVQRTLARSNATPPIRVILDSAASQVSRGPLEPIKNGPQIRGSIGPPFVPFPGTITNITTSTSGTVPTGGRNYATP